MKPLGQSLLDARITQVIHLGLLGIVVGNLVDEILGVLFRDGIGLDDRLVLRKPADDLRVQLSIDRKTLHCLVSRNGLGDILAVVAVDHPGRGSRAIQKNLEVDDGRIRVRRFLRWPFGAIEAIGALLIASG